MWKEKFIEVVVYALKKVFESRKKYYKFRMMLRYLNYCIFLYYNNYLFFILRDTCIMRIMFLFVFCLYVLYNYLCILKELLFLKKPLYTVINLIFEKKIDYGLWTTIITLSFLWLFYNWSAKYVRKKIAVDMCGGRSGIRIYFYITTRIYLLIGN